MNHDRLWLQRLSRRAFLRTGTTAAGVVLLGTLPARRGDATVRTAAYPFTLGVASGDPLPDGVVLWTRLVPDPLRGGGMPAQRVSVRWEIAHDEAFRRLAKSGEVLALPELGHSVHVEAEGLEPDRVYWYRFISGGETSPIGRTRTAPASGARVDHFAFAFASCQNFQQGYYTAYRHMAEEDLRLVLHLGDYIYEGGVGENVLRSHNSPEIVTLGDYRNRYALYKSDRDLQSAHAAFPFAVTWDDHEVDNNYADEISQDEDPTELFLQRRAAAYQAFYEHMPMRRAQMPTGPDLRLYRRLTFGGLAEFNVLDTRQYRDDQVMDQVQQLPNPARLDPVRSITGAAQERWLLDGLGASSATWNVLAQQVFFAERDLDAAERESFSMDAWDGYVGSRDRILGFIEERSIRNPMVLTGDVHRNWACDLKADFADESSRTLGVELVGTSISSTGDGEDSDPLEHPIVKDNPHIKFFNDQRGYVRCTLTPDRWTTDFRVVPYVTRPDAPIRTRASFVVENGRPGLQKA